MNTFLSKIANYLKENYGEDLSDIYVILPSKRAIVFLKKTLSELYENPFFAPKCFSIDDFIQLLAQNEIATADEQLVTIYKTHLQIESQKEFPKVRSLYDFAQKANVMMQDFNELDMELINPYDLFINLKDIKELTLYNLAEKDLSVNQKKYLSFFKELYDYYQIFNELLKENGKFYQGAIYRYVVENMKDIFSNLSFKKIVFVGFNALSKSEQKIVEYLQCLGKLDYLIDADTYYVNNKNHEAGQFIRQLQNIDNLSFIDDCFESISKKIHIIGFPQKVAQVKYLPQIINQLNCNDLSTETTAIIPADETLLQPILHTLNLSQANITMGYSLKNSVLYRLVDIVFQTFINSVQMQSNIHSKMDNAQFLPNIYYYRDLINLLSNIYIKLLIGKTNSYSNNFIAIGQIFYDKQTFDNSFPASDSALKDLLSSLLFSSKNANDVVEQIKLLIAFIDSRLQLKDVEKEVVLLLQQCLEHLKNLTKELQLKDIFSLQMLFETLLASYSLSFKSDAASSLQLLGVLETRTLDFDNVVILSLNEGVLPAGKTMKTFIPFDLRRHFGMSTYDGKDAIFSYHFYRLLQRATNIYLLYYSNGEENSEQSRYILQIKNELSRFTNIDIQEYMIAFVNPETNNSIPKQITMSKTPEIIQVLKNMSYSPTTITTYLKCSLRFYFSKVLNLNVEDDNIDELPAYQMGKAIHAVLANALNAETFNPCLSREQIEQAVLDYFEKEDEKCYSKTNFLQSVNYLNLNVIVKYIEDYLRLFREEIKRKSNFSVVDAEKKLEYCFAISSSENIHCKGIIDRIDADGEKISIVDYKTGKVEDKAMTIEEEKYNTTGFKEIPKEAFQLLFYAYLYYKNTNIVPSKARIIDIQKMSKEFVLKYSEKDKLLMITKDFLNDFEEKLKILFIDEILNPQQPFTMTENKKECQYCNFANICGV